ncbi:hypothetical protein QBE55_02230 [Eubacteriales bacterium mix99]
METVYWLAQEECWGRWDATTFSTFSLEAVQLLQNDEPAVALSYMVLSVTACTAAVAGAQALVK